MIRRKGFTLIELLIVTVVIVTLMGVVFRLAGMGGAAKQKNTTIARLQKIENALSGYYAAYGSYPPVPLHGHRDIYLRCNANGILNGRISGSRDFKSAEFKNQVEAACRAQPLAVRFPYNPDNYRLYIDALSEQCKMLCQMEGSAYQEWRDRKEVFSKGFGCLARLNEAGDYTSKSDWSDVHIFQFGLLSFLLPRYLFMLEGDNAFYDRCPQWERNNRHIRNFADGSLVTDWKQVQSALGTGKGNSGSSGNRSMASMITNLPSQAVCARWMPNFEKIIRGGRTFYGIDTSDGNGFNNADSPRLQVFSAGDGESSGDQYVLNGMTIWDGWYHDIYYYSEPPYQSYRLWSAGPDGRTFPPWIDLESISSESDRKLAAKWMADDIVHLSN